MEYESLNDAVAAVREMGAGAQLAVFNGTGYELRDVPRTGKGGCIVGTHAQVRYACLQYPDAGMVAFTYEDAAARDALTARLTAFPTFQAMLDAEGGYRPTIRVAESAELRELAYLYDEAQAKRGDSRRAYRGD